jgi:3-methyladenine DNA glycosylase/8-oxoguanine DNA glycosylase
VSAYVIADYDHNWLLRFLRPRAVPGVELFQGDTYVRAVRLGLGSSHILTLVPADRGFQVTIKPSVTRSLLLRSARVLTGTATDLDTFRAQAAQDAIIGPLVASCPGVRLVRFVDPFEGITRAILGQQVSLAAAATMAARLTALLGESVPKQESALRAFPSPLAVANAQVHELRALGLTGARIAALRAAARAIVDGTLDIQELARMSGANADAALRALPGIGPWTAAYIRMRVLGDADAFPASDLGVLKALQRILGVERVSAREAEALAEPWRPWRGLATIHLWESLRSDGGQGPGPGSTAVGV